MRVVAAKKPLGANRTYKLESLEKAECFMRVQAGKGDHRYFFCVFFFALIGLITSATLEAMKKGLRVGLRREGKKSKEWAKAARNAEGGETEPRIAFHPAPPDKTHICLP